MYLFFFPQLPNTSRLMGRCGTNRTWEKCAGPRRGPRRAWSEKAHEALSPRWMECDQWTLERSILCWVGNRRAVSNIQSRRMSDWARAEVPGEKPFLAVESLSGIKERWERGESMVRYNTEGTLGILSSFEFSKELLSCCIAGVALNEIQDLVTEWVKELSSCFWRTRRRAQWMCAFFLGLFSRKAAGATWVVKRPSPFWRSAIVFLQLVWLKMLTGGRK